MIFQTIIRWSFYALFILVPLIFTPQTSELFEFPKITLTYFLASIILCAWACRMIVERRWIFRSTPLDLPIIIFVTCNFVSLLLSVDQHMSIFGYYGRWNGGLLSLIVYSLLYWAIVSNLDAKSALRAMNYALFAAAFIAAWAILEKLGIYPSCLLTRGQLFTQCWIQDIQGRPFATLGQPNWLAAYLAALIFIPISKLLNFLAHRAYAFTSLKPQGNSKSQNSIHNFGTWNLGLHWSLASWGLVIATMLAALWVTGSRSGFLALAISAFVYLGYRYSKSLFLGIPLIILASALYITNLCTKHYALSTTQTESFCIRKIVWSGAINAWKASPKTALVGWGPETFTLAYYRHRPIAHNLTSEWELLYNKSHNEYLHYLTTTGVLGLAAYLYLLFSIFKTLKPQATSHKPQGNPKSQNSNHNLGIWDLNHSLGFGIWSLDIAMLSGWTTLLVTNFFGFSVTITNLLLFLLPAIALTLNSKPDNPLPTVQFIKLPTWLIIVPLLATCYVLFALVRFVQADMAYSTGHTYLSLFQSDLQSEQLVTSYDHLSQAFTFNPKEPVFASDLALAGAYSSVLTADLDATYSAQLAQSATDLADYATHASPSPNFARTQAKIYLLLDQPQAAIDSLLHAAILSPTDPRIPAGLAALYTLIGDASTSAHFASASALLKPDLTNTP